MGLKLKKDRRENLKTPVNSCYGVLYLHNLSILAYSNLLIIVF